MNAAYAHLVLNHFPILGTLFGLVLLSAALVRKSEDLKAAALVTFIVIGILSVPAYMSGEGAEEILEGYPGVTAEALDAVEEHEEAAVWALVLIELQAVLALVGLVGKRKSGRISGSIAIACLLVSLLAMASVLQTAHSGRDIRHPEAGSGAS